MGHVRGMPVLALVGLLAAAPPVHAQGDPIEAWASPPVEDAALQALYHASVQAADVGVFEAALAVALDEGAAPAARLAALGTVVTYVRPDIVLYLEDRSGLDGMPPLVWNDVWGNVDHPLLVEGEVALPAGATEAVTALVASLRDTTGGDPLLRDAAWWLTELHGFGG